MLLIVLFLSHCRQVRTSNQDVSRPFPEYHVAAESYILEDIEYIFYRYRVSWEEARIICTSRKAHLVTFDTETQMGFIVRAFEESQYAFESFWIGARTDSSGSWYWIHSQQKLDSDGSNLQIYNANSEDKRQCLSINLRNGDDRVFLPLPCTAQNAFVCQRHHESLSKTITLITTMQIGEKEFTLYSARATWPEAVLYCRHDGLQIAEVITSVEAESLALVMLRTRPEAIENAWIGGYSDDSIWKWLSSGDRIPADAHLWRKNESRKREGCLLLDRHICENPVYLESRCDRKRDILCQKRIQSTVEELANDVAIGVNADEDITEKYDDVGRTQQTTERYKNIGEAQNRTDSVIDIRKSFEDPHRTMEKIDGIGDDLCLQTSDIPTPCFVNETRDNHTMIQNNKQNVIILQPTKITPSREEPAEMEDDEDYYEYLDEYKFKSTFFETTTHTTEVDSAKKNEGLSEMMENDEKEMKGKQEKMIEVSTERTSEKPNMIFRLLSVRPYYAFEGPMKVEITSKPDSDKYLRNWQDRESSNKQSSGTFKEATVINDITVEIIKVNCRISGGMAPKTERQSL